MLLHARILLFLGMYLRPLEQSKRGSGLRMGATYDRCGLVVGIWHAICFDFSRKDSPGDEVIESTWLRGMISAVAFHVSLL